MGIPDQEALQCLLYTVLVLQEIGGCGGSIVWHTSDKFDKHHQAVLAKTSYQHSCKHVHAASEERKLEKPLRAFQTLELAQSSTL